MSTLYPVHSINGIAIYNGEWFELDETDLEYIKGLVEGI